MRIENSGIPYTSISYYNHWLCVCFLKVFFVCVFFSNLYLYNTVLPVLFCVNKDIIIKPCIVNYVFFYF